MPEKVCASPTVAVVVVSWNRAADLRRSLDAIFASTRPPSSVVVVDNASEDDAADVAASFPGVRLIRNQENMGFAEANEIALREIDSDYLALINNDALVEPSWIERMVEFLEAHPEAAASGGKQFFWDDRNPPFDTRNRYYSYTRIDPGQAAPQALTDTPDELREVATLCGAAVMIRRRAIEEVGPPFLEPLFFAYYEETDFFARAIRKGWRLYYTGLPAVWHRVRASTDAQPGRYQYLMRRNRVLWAYRHFDDAVLSRVLTESRAGETDGSSEDRSASREANAWISANRELLETHRARHIGCGRNYAEVIRAVEARANYYGYARPEVCALVPGSARQVIDFGCAGGGLGRHLKDLRPGLAVRGVEPVAEMARRARKFLDDVMVGRAEDPLPPTWPSPDCVIFADVLEHLVDPWDALRRARALLSPGGSLVVSIPNVLHHTVVLDLFRGRFDYRDAGVLDRTHLRFFTAATARELVTQAGFRVERIERVIEPPEWLPEWIVDRARGTPVADGLTARLADFCTVQFLMLAR